MPFYYFDLVVDGCPHGQGGMILEDLTVAADKADALVYELRILRPELRGRQSFVRVVNEGNQEVYRAPLDPVSSGSIQAGEEW